MNWRTIMKKAVITTIILALIASIAIAQEEPDDPIDNDFTRPTPSEPKEYGMLSVTGNIGLVTSSEDTFTYESPYLKVGFYYNLTKYVSLGFVGTVNKMEGPEYFVLERDFFQYPVIKTQVTFEDYSTAQIEESAYGISTLIRPFSGDFTVYIPVNIMYASIDYEQFLIYRYTGDTEDRGKYIFDRFSTFKASIGLGLEYKVAGYMALLLEGEWATYPEMDTFDDQIYITLGVRMII